jgi:hypothetical protein
MKRTVIAFVSPDNFEPSVPSFVVSDGSGDAKYFECRGWCSYLRYLYSDSSHCEVEVEAEVEAEVDAICLRLSAWGRRAGGLDKPGLLLCGSGEGLSSG